MSVEQINESLDDEFKYTPEELEEIARLEKQNKDSDTFIDPELDPEAEHTPSEDPKNPDDPEFDFDDETLADLTKPTVDPNDPPAEEIPGGKADTPDPEIAPEIDPEPEIIPPDFGEQLEELQQRHAEAKGKAQDTLDKISDLGQQLDDGEIGQGRYDAELARLQRDLAKHDRVVEKLDGELESLQGEADNKIAEYQEQVRAAWKSDLRSFLGQPENALIAGNINVAEKFDSIFNEYAEKGIFEGMNNHQVLQTIRDRLSMTYELPPFQVKATKQAKAAAEQKPNPKPPKPTQQDKPIPVSLTQSSAIESPQDDPFVHIKKLKGIAYEEAIAALSPAQRDKFLFG